MKSLAPIHRGRRFDRFPSRDPRRGNYMLAEVIEPQEKVPVLWSQRIVTDQGHEGACVGHGETTDLIGSPRPDPYVTVDQANTYALGHYHRAQVLDPWAGEAYEGTSVDAGFQVSRERGYIDGWRWMENVDRIRDAVIARGPVILGIDWYDEMYDTNPSGLVKVGGSIVGGHSITIIGYHPGMRITGEDWYARYEVFTWQNSWGLSYGKNGRGYLLATDLNDFMNAGGEAGVAFGRKLVRLQSFAG